MNSPLNKKVKGEVRRIERSRGMEVRFAVGNHDSPKLHDAAGASGSA
jgi:hypothetical protein